MVHYQNPRVLVACVAEFESKLLLCRRAIAPAQGLWFLPSGFMEQDEALEDAAARELEEETGVALAGSELSLYSVLSIPCLSEIYVIYRTLLGTAPALIPGLESLEVGFFSIADCPPQLAFPNFSRGFLECYYHDATRGHFPVRSQTIDLLPDPQHCVA